MGICFFLYKSTYDPVKNINRNWISSHKWVESTSSNSSPYGFSNLLKPTIGDKMSWDTSPKTGPFLQFTNFKTHPCNVVPMFELPTENNQHPNFERRGQGRGEDSFVLWSYPIWVQCLNNFDADCSLLESVREEKERINWLQHACFRALWLVLVLPFLKATLTI